MALTDALTQLDWEETAPRGTGERPLNRLSRATKSKEPRASPQACPGEGPCAVMRWLRLVCLLTGLSSVVNRVADSHDTPEIAYQWKDLKSAGYREAVKSAMDEQ